MRALLLVVVAVFFLGCRKEDDKVAPSRRGSLAEATPEQVQALHAGNERLTAKINLHMQETKRMPENLDALKTWAGARWEAGDDSALVDPWGNKILMHIQLSSGGTAITLRSKGPDGKTSDDDLMYDSRDKQTLTEAQRASK